MGEGDHAKRGGEGKRRRPSSPPCGRSPPPINGGRKPTSRLAPASLNLFGFGGGGGAFGAAFEGAGGAAPSGALGGGFVAGCRFRARRNGRLQEGRGLALAAL